MISTGGLAFSFIYCGIVQKSNLHCFQLNNYDSDESVSKSFWLQEHYKLMQATNQCALKSKKKSAEQSALRTGGKELPIPEGNLVLL